MFIGGGITAVTGIATLALGRLGVMPVLLLFFGGVGAIAMAQLDLLMDIATHLAKMREHFQLLELLTDVADHSAAIRTQLGKGIVGLFG
jgi:hypothetical protein